MTNKYFDNIAFIGGIHGVGKSTVCSKLCLNKKIHYLSASEALKWKDINEDSRNKKVRDIPFTQNRLIEGLINSVRKENFYLLDGHYCLLNGTTEIVRVPKYTFEQINPKALYLILGNVAEIKYRLEKRDNRPYDYQLLEDMQNCEISYATELSMQLNIKLYIGSQFDFSNIQDSLNLFTINQ